MANTKKNFTGSIFFLITLKEHQTIPTFFKNIKLF